MKADDPRIDRIAQRCIFLHVRRASRVVSQLYEEALSDCDLNPAQFLLLVALARLGPSPLSSIADRLQLDRTTLTRNLAALVDSKLVSIAADPRDRRSRIVSILRPGLNAIERSYASWEIAQRRVAEQLGDSRVNQILGELNQLATLK
jgi:DNA-binding MarR family transcriptional regulator